MNNLEPCSICCSYFTNPVKLENCNHIFCQICIATWLQVPNDNCPNCREPLVVRNNSNNIPNFNKRSIFDSNQVHDYAYTVSKEAMIVVILFHLCPFLKDIVLKIKKMRAK